MLKLVFNIIKQIKVQLKFLETKPCTKCTVMSVPLNQFSSSSQLKGKTLNLNILKTFLRNKYQGYFLSWLIPYFNIILKDVNRITLFQFVLVESIVILMMKN